MLFSSSYECKHNRYISVLLLSLVFKFQLKCEIYMRDLKFIKVFMFKLMFVISL